jgi:hypothetical protein
MVMRIEDDYVDGVRTAATARLLFIPQVIYKHGEPWWNNIDRGKLLIRPPEISDNPASRVIW